MMETFEKVCIDELCKWIEEEWKRGSVRKVIVIETTFEKEIDNFNSRLRFKLFSKVDKSRYM